MEPKIDSCRQPTAQTGNMQNHSPGSGRLLRTQCALGERTDSNLSGYHERLQTVHRRSRPEITAPKDRPRRLPHRRPKGLDYCLGAGCDEGVPPAGAGALCGAAPPSEGPNCGCAWAGCAGVEDWPGVAGASAGVGSETRSRMVLDPPPARAPRIVRVSDVSINTTALTVVARVSSVAPLRGPNAVWEPMPPKALEISPAFPLCSRTTTIRNRQTIT